MGTIVRGALTPPTAAAYRCPCCLGPRGRSRRTICAANLASRCPGTCPGPGGTVINRVVSGRPLDPWAPPYGGSFSCYRALTEIPRLRGAAHVIRHRQRTARRRRHRACIPLTSPPLSPCSTVLSLIDRSTQPISTLYWCLAAALLGTRIHSDAGYFVGLLGIEKQIQPARYRRRRLGAFTSNVAR